MQPVLAACERYYNKPKKEFTEEETLVYKALSALFNNRDDGYFEQVDENALLRQQLRDIREIIT